MAGDFNFVKDWQKYSKLPRLKPSEFPMPVTDLPQEMVAMAERKGLHGDLSP